MLRSMIDRQVVPVLFCLLPLAAALPACGSDGSSGDQSDATSTDATTTDSTVAVGADATITTGVDAVVVSADARDCAGSVCGTVTYSGAYTGPAVMIHVSVYKQVGSASLNPTAAVGQPDFVVSRSGAGNYQVDLGGYEGTVFVAAFMDVDSSGQPGGPTANATATNGVYSDPMGAHGGYTFDGTAGSEPTAVVVTSTGASGIDIALADSGVISGQIHAGTGGSGAVVVGAFVPEPGGAFWHHTEMPTFTDGITYLLAIPPGDHWLIRTTVGSKVGFYPQNPPPPPPSNATPVTVTANSITSGIDMTIANLGGP